MDEKTQSVCPVCLRVIDARRVVGEDGCIYIEKTCPDHGASRALIWEGSEESYRAWGASSRPEPDRPPAARAVERGCPHDCGLCEAHENPGCCVLLELTDRCDLSCPVCFASAGAVGSDLPMEEISRQYDMLMASGGPFNIQLSGGEPTCRDDLPQIVALGRRKGFTFFQLNTNGLRLANERGYARKLRDAGVSCAFLQFDGLSDDTYVKLRGRPLLREKIKALTNCASAGLPVVLVPTVVEGVNDGELGEIIELAISRMPAVRGVHIQPMSFFGRYASERTERRLTIPRLLALIDQQTDGLIRAEHFAGGSAEAAYCSFHASFRRQPDGTLRPLPSRGQSCCARSSDAMEHVARQWSADPYGVSTPSPGAASCCDESSCCCEESSCCCEDKCCEDSCCDESSCCCDDSCCDESSCCCEDQCCDDSCCEESSCCCEDQCCDDSYCDESSCSCDDACCDAARDSEAQPSGGSCCGFDEFLKEAHDSTFALSGMLFQDAWTLDLARLRRCHICEVDSERGMIPFCAYNLTDASGRALYRRAPRGA